MHTEHCYDSILKVSSSWILIHSATIAPVMLRRSLIFILHLLLLSFGYEVGLVGWRDGSKGLAVESEGEFGAGFGDAEEFEVGPTLVTDGGLVEAAVAIEDLDHGVVDAILKAKEEVEVAKVDVSVDGDHGEAETGKEEANVGDGGGLAHATLAEGDDGNARGGAGELGLVIPLESSWSRGFRKRREKFKRKERRGSKRENLKFTLLR
ncbi:hypothetical protein GmHk_04G011534 [Glycine max]|nr:hypothetical protein GmHk_04G011534 [Glycine max]